MLFDYQIIFKNDDDYVSSIDIYMKQMVVVVTSKQEQNFIITPNLKQTRIFKDLQIPISKLFINDVHHELVLAGLESGELLIKQPNQLINNEFQDLVRPTTTVAGDLDVGPVTCISTVNYCEKLIYGTKNGFITVYELATKQAHTFLLDKNTKNKKIKQIEELPTDV